MSTERILAIDPGDTHSAWVLYDTGSPVGTVARFGKSDNDAVLAFIDDCSGVQHAVIEMIACYGMPVGREVFETCAWIGRFEEAYRRTRLVYPHRMFRRDVKLNLCNTTTAKDGNVRAALIDRFGPGKDRAVGTKKNPGPLYGLSGDCWAALGVAYTFADKLAYEARVGA